MIYELEIKLKTFGDFSIRGWFLDKDMFPFSVNEEMHIINIIADETWSCSIHEEIEWLRKCYPNCKISFTTSNFLI